MFIGLGCCPLTGYNPGLLLASLLDITPLHNGVDSTVPHVGVGQKGKPQLTFCVSEALVILRCTYLGSFFLDPENVRSLCLGQYVTLLKEQGCQFKMHKGPDKKAYVHQDWKGLNPFIILIYSTPKYYSIFYNRM